MAKARIALELKIGEATVYRILARDREHTTFSLKDELGWRKIAMSAYDEDSISVRGGEEGDACTHRSDPTEY
jgi:hypothetical protein